MRVYIPIIECVVVLIVLLMGNSFSLSAQTISLPKEPLLSRMERIAAIGKENGQFVTYESRFLEGITAPALTTQSADVEEWIRHSLKNTPLTYRKVNDNRFVIVRQSDETPATGSLAGKVTDAFGVPLAGATVQLPSLQKGTITGMNGDYSLIVPPGSYDVKVVFMGFESVQIQEVGVTKNRTIYLDIALKEANIHLDEVVVTYAQPESTIAGALRARRNTPYISAVLGSQQIDRLGATTLQDAMTLLPGVSFDESRSQIVRGTGGRWNEILLDGIPLCNYDPSYRIFSFDLIPVSLVDNIRLFKSSTPDIPVGFAGGVTEVVTKDIPAQNYVQATISYQFNSIGTFKNHRGRRGGRFDLIGLDDRSREIPGVFQSVIPGIPQRMSGNATLFPDAHFAISDRKANPPSQYNLTLGRTYALNEEGDRLGFVLSLSYQHNAYQSVINHTQRGRWDYESQYMGDDIVTEWNHGRTYYYNTVTGGVLNAGWQFGKNRISFRNLFTRSFDNDLTEVTAHLKDIPGSETNLNNQFFNYPIFSGLYQNKLEGQHAVSDEVQLKWNASHTLVEREQKDAAFSEMYKPLRVDSLLYFLHQHPTLRALYPASSGWYMNREHSFHAGVSATYAFLWDKIHNKMMFGYNTNYRYLRFRSNEALYSYDSNPVLDPSYRVYQLLERNHFSGEAVQHHPFVMFEHRWNEKMRFVWGLRGDYESYRTIQTNGKEESGRQAKWYAVPSANLTYMPIEKMNLRLSFQQSVIRPKLSDRIPFPVYDTYLLGTSFNRDVYPSTVQAVDLVVEKYMNSEDIVSAGLFYRDIDHPIERTTYLDKDEERMYVLQNSDKAYTYGFEAEMRKHLGFIGDTDFLSKIQFSAGLVLTRSSVRGKQMIVIKQKEGDDIFIETESTQNRPLSGQTPYQWMVGINYSDKSMHASILFDRSGRQLYLLGESAYQHEYRAPLNSVETSISYRFPKNDIRLKVSGRNLINTTQVFYRNTKDDYARGENGAPIEKLLPGKSENYDKGRDPIVHEVRNGRIFMISISCTF